jgi:hypothetical protein
MKLYNYKVIQVFSTASTPSYHRRRCIFNQSNFFAHLILEARNRIGDHIVSDTLEGVQVDLGATFIHNLLFENALDAMIKEMGWSTAPEKFYLIYISILCLLGMGVLIVFLNWRENQEDKRDHYNFIQMIR